MFHKVPVWDIAPPMGRSLIYIRKEVYQMSATLELTRPDEMLDETLLEDDIELDTDEEVAIDIDEEVDVDMAGGEHGEIITLLTWHLAAHVYPNKIGRLFDGQTSFLIGGTTPYRQPDVSFVTIERMPERIMGKISFAPDLAIEVVSENDTVFDLERKIKQYQAANVRRIWVIYPLSQTVAVYKPDSRKPTLLDIDEEFDGEEVLPGFKLKVSALF